MEKDLLKSEIKKLEDQNFDLEEQKQDLYKENQGPADDRTKAQKKSSIFTALIVFSVIAIVISFFVHSEIKYIVIAVAVMAIIISIIVKIKLNNRIKKISLGLEEYDRKVSALDQQISSNNAEISKRQDRISRIELEEKLKEYTKNHICVYVGFSAFPRKGEQKPQRLVRDATIYIDGMEIGGAEEPFTAFEVTPGTHVVKIEACDYLGGQADMPERVTSKAIQVKVTDNSKYLLFHWSINKNPKGPGNGFVYSLSADEFSDLFEFMTASNQKWD